MPSFAASRTIQAPIAAVFRTISDIENLSEALPYIVKVEFLSHTRSGDGTRFRETRCVNGREATAMLQITEYVENHRVRLVGDAGGSIWDSVFTVTEENGGTRLDMEMEGRAYGTISWILNFFIRGMVQKAVEGDLDAVKSYCEKNHRLAMQPS